MKDKKLEKFDDELGMSSGRNKTKEIIMYVGIVLMVLTLIVMKFLMVGELKNNSKDVPGSTNNKPVEVRPTNANDVSEDTLSLACSLSDKDGNRINNGVTVFGKGEYLVCSINMNYKYNEKIASMSFDYESEDVEILKATTTSSMLNVSLENNQVSIKRLSDKSIVDRYDIDEVSLYLYIKNNKNYEVNLNNVNINILNEDRVDYISNKKITIANGGGRFYKENNVFIFEKAQEDGTFKKVNEYKCKDLVNCNANPASQTFHYRNDNQNVTMIADENHNTFVMFDVEKGIIGTYTGSAVWLRTNDLNNKYIYIQDKLTGMYGIIDVDGNVIHEFNLTNTSGIYINGMLNSTYSVENDLIVETKNGKFGISKIKSNDTVIDYNFDAIRLFATNVRDENNNSLKTVSGKYFEGKINNKWYLYSLETKNMVFTEGYDNIFVINDEIFIVESNKNLYIKDVNGNNLVEAIPSLANTYNEAPCCGQNFGIEVVVKGDVVTIKTYADSNSDTVYNHYEFAISTKNLNKIK